MAPTARSTRPRRRCKASRTAVVDLSPAAVDIGVLRVGEEACGEVCALPRRCFVRPRNARSLRVRRGLAARCACTPLLVFVTGSGATALYHIKNVFCRFAAPRRCRASLESDFAAQSGKTL